MGGNFSNSIIKKKLFKCTIIVIDIIIVVSIMFIKMLFSFFIFLIKKS